jgi:methenyltetrahydromethanopterin cyclohydrolase
MSIAEDLFDDTNDANVEFHEVGEANVVDCGVETVGSLLAARTLVDVCLANLGSSSLSTDRLGNRPCSKVTVEIDEPAAACLLSQYAGWKISFDDYFAMGSGPMRAILAEEPVFERYSYRETADVAVGVLESSKLPDENVIEEICDALDLQPYQLTLLVARTASIAGTYQVVARSVETCMHKLFELGFDVTRVRSAIGSAFLPPVPKDDQVAIGRTNDSILYGGEVFLWVEGDDASLAEIGPKVPACASPDYGKPFAEIFKSYDGDFYQIDPLLFSPAVVVINNLSTGGYFEFGKTDHDLLIKSFFSA